MRLLICAGGTGGGVYPALSILQTMLKNDNLLGHHQNGSSTTEILWVGSHGGMEGEIVKRHGIKYKAIAAAGVHGVNIMWLPKNLFQISKGFVQAWRILAQYKPDVILFTGGYVAIPMAFAALFSFGKFRTPKKVVFIPDIEPGLALKTLMRTADCIAVSTRDTIKYLPKKKETLISGYPVRAEFYMRQNNARQHFGLDDQLPVLLVYGGSLGARSINKAIIKIIEQILPEMQVIHVTGKLDWEEVQAEEERIQKKMPDYGSRYKPFEYLHEDMPLALQAADLVVCRSGASVLGELPAVGTAAILVPYPYAWRYQETNAAFLVDHGAAKMIKDDQLEEKLLPAIMDCIRDRTQLSQMRAAMKQLAKPEAAEMIVQKLFQLGAAKKN